jgi:hypothetical protein
MSKLTSKDILDHNNMDIDYPSKPHHSIISVENNLDITSDEKVDYPIIEASNNSLLWPEGPKGNIDMNDTYEISAVPENPSTSLDSVETLVDKGVMPQ